MITSNNNANVKQVVQWQTKAKERRKDHVFLAEGIRMCEEAPVKNVREVYLTEEMEQKMPNSVVLSSFSATGTDVTFQLHAASKEEAAQVLIEMRTFESLDTVSTSGLEETENGEEIMTVVCTYAQPAALDSRSN